MRKTFQDRATLHAGMGTRKPLLPYNPNSTRSRMPVATIVMPYKNASQVVIGDRTTVYKKHFASTNKFQQLKPVSKPTSNTGIAAERTKWIHKC